MPGAQFKFTQAGADEIARAYRTTQQAAAKAAADAIRSAQKLLQAEERAAQQAVKAAERAGTQKARAAERAAQQAAKAAEKAATAAAKSGEQELKAAQRAEDQKAKASERSAERRLRAAQRLADGIVREESRAAKAAERAAKTAERNAEKNAFWRAGGTARNVIGAVGGAAVTGLSLALGTVGAAARESMQLQALSNRVSINARQAGQAFIDPTTLRKEFEGLSLANPGIKGSDIAGGVLNYVNLTGDATSARRLAGTFATTASATGASVSDVAGAAASIGRQFGVTGEADTRRVMAILNQQGKQGAFMLGDASQYFAEMGASARRFGLDKGVSGVATLGGLAQIARTSTGGGAEAATAVERLLGNLVEHSGKLGSGKYGKRINVFDKGGNARSIQDVMGDLIAGAGGNNLGKKTGILQEVLGERGIKAASPLINAYKEAFGEAKTGGKSDKDAEAAGRAAIAAAFHTAIDSATEWSEVEKDAAQAQKDTSARLSGAWEKVVGMVGAELAPKLATLLPAFANLVLDALPLGAAFEVLAGAVEGTAAGLKALREFLEGAGLLKHKEKTGLEKYNDAKAALVKFDKDHEHAMGPIADFAEREKLVKNIADLDKEAYASATSQGIGRGTKAASKGPETREEWAKRYADASGFAPGTPGYDDAKRGAQRRMEHGMYEPSWSVDQPEAQKQMLLAKKEDVAKEGAAAKVAVGASLLDFTTRLGAGQKASSDAATKAAAAHEKAAAQLSASARALEKAAAGVERSKPIADR